MSAIESSTDTRRRASPAPPEGELGEVRTDRARLLQLRWLSVSAMALLATLVFPLLAPAHPRQPLFAVMFGLIAVNLALHAGALRRVAGRRGAFVQLTIDLCAWGAFLFFGGGVTNPAIALLLPLVAVGAAILSARQAWALAVLAVFEYSVLWHAHRTVQLADAQMAMTWHLAGMWLGFTFSALTVVWFVSRLNAALQHREHELAVSNAARARDAHVVGLGKLAAGAAHRLGTPLGTLRILADELALRPELRADSKEDLALMQVQIDHCRDILNSLAREAGQQRAEGGGAVAPGKWVGEVLTRWRALRPHAHAVLVCPAAVDRVRIVADASLGEALHNLIDNAANANAAAGKASDEVAIEVSVGAGDLIVDVADRGPGMGDAVRAAVRMGPLEGDASGMGIGLYLAHSAVEHHGGRIDFLHRQGGGTIARLVVPLQEAL